MSINSINLNILNSTFGSSGLSSQASTNPKNTAETLASVASQQLSLPNQLLDGLNKGDSTTSNLVSLSLTAQNQLATTKLPDDIRQTVGSIINEKV